MNQSHLFNEICSTFRFQEEDVARLFLKSWIVDGRAGGLVIGRSHEEGNIYMLGEKEGAYRIVGNLQGGEYLLNCNAFLYFEDRIKRINDFCDVISAPKKLSLNIDTRIIHTHAEPFDKLIFVEGGQFIINKEATSKHLAEITKLNSIKNCRSNCSLMDYIVEFKRHP